MSLAKTQGLLANRSNHLPKATYFILLASAALCFTTAGYIQIKAVTAQLLISSAWAKTLDKQDLGQRPWPWMDTWPVAKLEVPRLGVKWIVLNGIEGQSLAFGPGYLRSPGAELNQQNSSGVTLIAGHNDTHFRFLKSLHVNDTIRLQNQYGGWRTYQVAELATATAENNNIALNAENIHSDDLILMTCDSALQAVVPRQRRLIAHLTPVLRKF